MKISLQELTFYPTDETWFPSFDSKSKKQFREIVLIGFSITLNLNEKLKARCTFDPVNHRFKKGFEPPKPATKTGITFKLDESHQEFNDKMHSNRIKKGLVEEDELLEREYHLLRQSDTYILFPIDIVIKNKIELDLSRDFSYDPQQSIMIEIKNPVIFMLNKNYMRYLGALNEHIRAMNIVKKNIHLRPTELPKENPIAWWVYAIKAVREERKSVSSLAKNTANLLKMRRYINLYKRKQ